jgi:TolB protein
MTQPPVPLSLTRRRLLAGAGALAVLAPRSAGAVLRLDITQGNVQPMPIALPDFVSESDIGRNVTAVISGNLQRSGLFAPINPAAFIEKVTNSDNVPRFTDWRTGDRPHHASGRRTVEGGVSLVGCVRRPATRRQAVFHDAG